MLHQARKNKDVKEISEKIEKVYNRYPFLKGISKPFQNE
jgi:hypothetical protein